MAGARSYASAARAAAVRCGRGGFTAALARPDLVLALQRTARRRVLVGHRVAATLAATDVVTTAGFAVALLGTADLRGGAGDRPGRHLSALGFATQAAGRAIGVAEAEVRVAAVLAAGDFVGAASASLGALLVQLAVLRGVRGRRRGLGDRRWGRRRGGCWGRCRGRCRGGCRGGRLRRGSRGRGIFEATQLARRAQLVAADRIAAELAAGDLRP